MQGGDLLGKMLRKPCDLFLLFTLNRVTKLVEIGLRFSKIILNDGAAGAEELSVKRGFSVAWPINGVACARSAIS